MNSGHVFERMVSGRAFVVRVIDGLRHAGAVHFDGEIVIGRRNTPEETEAAINAATARASSEVEKDSSVILRK